MLTHVGTVHVCINQFESEHKNTLEYLLRSNAASKLRQRNQHQIKTPQKRSKNLKSTDIDPHRLERANQKPNTYQP